MAEARVAHEVIEREWGRALEVLAGLPDDAWSAPTRCEGWTVADLVGHAAWGTSFEADGLRRARTREGGVAVGAEVAADASPSARLAALAAGVAALVEEVAALAAEPHDRPVPMPYGELPLTVALDVFAMEAGLHVSDLAAALGRSDRLEPDVSRAAFAFLRGFGAMLADQGGGSLDPGQSVALAGSQVVRFRHDGDRWLVDDGPATTTIRAGDSDLLLFAYGRRSRSAVSVEGDEALAGRFKQLVPGP